MCADVTLKDVYLFGLKTANTELITLIEQQKQLTTKQKILIAAQHGFAEKVRQLLDLGASIAFRYESGQTLLMYATFKGHFEVVKVLLEYGTPPNDHDQNGWNALHYAASGDHAAIIDLLIAHGAGSILNVGLSKGHNPLYVAVYYNKISAANCLLKHGADPNSITAAWSPLQWAAAHGRLEIVKSLVKHGAEPNYMGFREETALSIARHMGYSDVMAFLKPLTTVD